MAKRQVVGRIQQMLMSICGVLNMALSWIDPKDLKPHLLPLSVPLRWIYGEKNVWLSDIGNNCREELVRGH